MLADRVEAPTDDAIVIWGNGPRVRVYCLFGDSAISAEDKNEDALAICPTGGDWSMSLPCPPEDLSWVQEELAKHRRELPREASVTRFPTKNRKQLRIPKPVPPNQ